MKKFLPYLIGGVGLMMVCIALVLRNGSPEAETVITNLASTFMLTAGIICVIGGLVTFFLRDDETLDVW
jgi:hypothetical protein